LENKPTFECHPQLDSVIDKLNSILQTPTENIIDTFFELYPKDNEGKIKYNFKKNTDDIVDIVVKDVSTGLIRDKITEKIVIHTGYLWWVPSPGSLEGLGDIDLLFYKNDNYIGKKRIHYNGGREIIVKGEKLSFDHLNGNNYSTFWEISINQDYDIQQNCLVDKDDVVLDIGANYGFFSLDSLSKGAKKIYSIEPYPEAYHHLVELSNKYPEIFPINKAVSSENGTLKFMVNKNTSSVNCLENHLEGSEDQYYGIDVESININTLLENLPEKVSFMKVDCEGAELELFESITNTNLKKIQKVAIETHGDEIEQFVRQRLLENNFRVYKPNNIVFGINFN
jgi:FkbM family methyltransferase